MHLEEVTIEYQYFVEMLENCIELSNAAYENASYFNENEVKNLSNAKQMENNIFYMEKINILLKEIWEVMSQIDFDFTKHSTINLEHSSIRQIINTIQEDAVWVDSQSNLSEIFRRKDD